LAVVVAGRQKVHDFHEVGRQVQDFCLYDEIQAVDGVVVVKQPIDQAL